MPGLSLAPTLPAGPEPEQDLNRPKPLRPFQGSGSGRWSPPSLPLVVVKLKARSVLAHSLSRESSLGKLEGLEGLEHPPGPAPSPSRRPFQGSGSGRWSPPSPWWSSSRSVLCGAFSRAVWAVFRGVQVGAPPPLRGPLQSVVFEVASPPFPFQGSGSGRWSLPLVVKPRSVLRCVLGLGCPGCPLLPHTNEQAGGPEQARPAASRRPFFSRVQVFGVDLLGGQAGSKICVGLALRLGVPARAVWAPEPAGGSAAGTRQKSGLETS